MLIVALQGGPPAHAWPWLLLSNALVVSVLCIVALHSDWRGWRLGTSVAAIPTIIACVNAIEGTFFLKIAPLLIPNPVCPDTVQWVHMCEMSSSNSVFGTIVGWVWGPPGLAQSAVSRSAA
jgi:hypothetical protein